MLKYTYLLNLIYKQNLPKTSYYKLIDYWLLNAVNCLVFAMAMHTYLIRVISMGGDSNSVKPFHNNEEWRNHCSSKASKINFWGKAGFIALAIVPNIILGSIGFSHFTSFQEAGSFNCTSNPTHFHG